MNKRAELAAVEAFLASLFPTTSSIEEWNRERPDVLARIDGRLVGIEVTTLSESTPRQSTAPQQWVAEAERLVRFAKESFERRSSSALVVRFEMSPSWKPPRRADMLKLADTLASLAEHAIANPPWSLRAGEAITLHDPHPSVAWAYVDRTRQEWGGHWAPSFGQQVVDASSDDIRVTLDRKEPELVAYRLAASQVWLLIDCDLVGQGIALDVPTADFRITTSFDRVYCFGFGRWQWVEIPVQPVTESTAG